MDLNKFTIKAQEAVQRAQQLALEYDNQSIECGHLLNGSVVPGMHVKVDEVEGIIKFEPLSADLVEAQV